MVKNTPFWKTMMRTKGEMYFENMGKNCRQEQDNKGQSCGN